MNHQAHLNVKKFQESQREKRTLDIRRKTLSFAKTKNLKAALNRAYQEWSREHT